MCAVAFLYVALTVPLMFHGDACLVVLLTNSYMLYAVACFTYLCHCTHIRLIRNSSRRSCNGGNNNDNAFY